jgi:hypothetical protein
LGQEVSISWTPWCTIPSNFEVLASPASTSDSLEPWKAEPKPLVKAMRAAFAKVFEQEAQD